jgi:hypothetical protein
LHGLASSAWVRAGSRGAALAISKRLHWFLCRQSPSGQIQPPANGSGNQRAGSVAVTRRSGARSCGRTTPALKKSRAICSTRSVPDATSAASFLTHRSGVMPMPSHETPWVSRNRLTGHAITLQAPVVSATAPPQMLAAYRSWHPGPAPQARMPASRVLSPNVAFTPLSTREVWLASPGRTVQTPSIAAVAHVACQANFELKSQVQSIEPSPGEAAATVRNGSRR